MAGSSILKAVFAGCILCISFDAVSEDIVVPSKIDVSEEPVQPLEKKVGLDVRKVALGQKLFFDKRLSQDGSLSCFSCHDVRDGGALHTKFAPPGVSKKFNPINVPTVFGSSENFSQFWDGRAESLEAQIDGPIHNPNEMGSNWPDIIKKLNEIPEYKESFKKIYGGAATKERVKDALTTFENEITPTDSPFDRYLKGDMSAISLKAQKGYQLFKNLGCVSCHQGKALGGNMFQKFGIIGDYFKDRGNIIEQDYGRYNVTKNEEDKHVFKVPSLRNIALTAPYFHDGSADTLEKAVDIMAKYQLGRTLSKTERDYLISFLNSLTGKITLQLETEGVEPGKETKP